MKIKSTTDLAKFAFDQYKKSDLNQYKIAELIGLKQPAVCAALNKRRFDNPVSNKTRLEILSVLGFEVESCFIVTKKIKKKQ